MKKITTNILKATIGKLSPIKQVKGRTNINWYNQKIIKHQEDQTFKKFRIAEVEIHYRRPYELLHTYAEIFTKGIYQFKTASEQPLIIDCGSNIGMSVVFFKLLYPKARVIAFEPDPENFKLLEKNVLGNKLSEVTLKQAAIWTANGTISFSSAASEASHISAQGSGTQVVNSVRLADLLMSEEFVDFLKVDIEGAEWPVIQDCAGALQNVQHLFLEYHGKTSETYKLAGIMKLLQEAGFSVYVQSAADNLTQPFVNKTTNSAYDVQLNLFCFKS